MKLGELKFPIDLVLIPVFIYLIKKIIPVFRGLLTGGANQVIKKILQPPSREVLRCILKANDQRLNSLI